MSHTSVLRRMLNSCSLVQLEDHYESKKVKLSESKISDSSIEILHVPPNTIVLDLDSAFNIEKLFHGKAGECKRADYILLSESAERVLFIEMKRSNSSATDISLQLRGALCAFEYCQIIAREFFDEHNFLKTYQKRFISIRHTDDYKRKTAIERTAGLGQKHCLPDTPLRISWAKTIQFKQLAA